MPINFIPNDPDVTTLPMRKITPHPDRAATRAGFVYSGAVPQGVYDPKTQTMQFLFWQCREAALSALDMWEGVTGRPMSTWEEGKKIDLIPNAGDDANAYYNRASLSFFQFTTGGTLYLSGASTDVVAHETGHGILDSIRPDLWAANGLEINAFHEAFGDCVAILTALYDRQTRSAVLADVAKDNVVESTAENLSKCIKQAIKNGDLPKYVI